MKKLFLSAFLTIGLMGNAQTNCSDCKTKNN